MLSQLKKVLLSRFVHPTVCSHTSDLGGIWRGQGGHGGPGGSCGVHDGLLDDRIGWFILKGSQERQYEICCRTG